MVDNQFSWAQRPEQRLELATQYGLMLTTAGRIVFNSEVNRDYFIEKGLVAPADPRVHLIPNWYRLPAGVQQASTRPVGRARRPVIVYSGNMNDRVDWTAMDELAEQIPEADLMLVGSAARAGEELSRLLMHRNVSYAGACDERDTLHVLRGADVAVMPHVTNDVSSFMNPLKLKMYAAVGLPTIALPTPGLAPDGGLLRVATRQQFVETVRKVLAESADDAAGGPDGDGGTTRTCDPTEDASTDERRYLDLVAEVLAGGRSRQVRT